MPEHDKRGFALHGEAEMAIIDTNVLFYFIDTTEPRKHESAKNWFVSIQGKRGYCISKQNLREFASIAIQKTKLTADEINGHVGLFASSFSVINDTVADCIEAVEIAREYKIKYWDSLIVATMKRNGIKKIISEDSKDFGKHKGIECVNIIT